MIVYSISWDIIYPRRRLPLHYLCVWIQSCEVWSHRMITAVNAFRSSALQMARIFFSINVLTHPVLEKATFQWSLERANLVSCKNKNYIWKNKKYWKKNASFFVLLWIIQAKGMKYIVFHRRRCSMLHLLPPRGNTCRLLGATLVDSLRYFSERKKAFVAKK